MGLMGIMILLPPIIPILSPVLQSHPRHPLSQPAFFHKLLLQGPSYDRGTCFSYAPEYSTLHGFKVRHAHRMSFKKLPLAVAAVSLLVGIPLSGYMARKGAISAGHDPTAAFPFPDLTGSAIFILGSLVCPILAVCLVKLLSRALPKSPYHFILSTLVISPLMAFPMGASANRWWVWNLARESVKNAESSYAQRAESDAHLARLIFDPEIAVRERWFERKHGNENNRYLFIESLKDSRVHYSIAQLASIYQEAPEARVLVVAHPTCDEAFLVDHWTHALQEAEAGNREIVTAMASNPKTPRALLEKLESSSLLSHCGTPDALKQALDIRLHAEGRVMSKLQMIQATTAIGRLKIHAGPDLLRSCEWENATRSTILEARTESSTDGSTLYFRGYSEDSFEYRVTKRIEFREGRRSFQTLEHATQWILQQSERMPTVYRNDGLLVSSDINPERNQLTVEVWQILIKSNQPDSLLGADDSKITFTDPIPKN